MHVPDSAGYPSDSSRSQADLERAMANIEQTQRSNLERSIEAVAAIGRKAGAGAGEPTISAKKVTKSATADLKRRIAERG